MEYILLAVLLFFVFSLYQRIGFLDNALKTVNREVEKIKTEVTQLQNPSIPPQDISSQRVQPLQNNHVQSVSSVAKPESLSIASQYQQSTKTTAEVIKKDEMPTKKDENQFDLIEWIRKDFLVKVGGFFMVIALAWFVSFAFANDWIGPEGRVSIGILFGVLLMVIGYWQLPKNPAPARVITLVGTTTILTTLYTSHAILGLFTPTIILFGMIVTIAFTVLISIIHDSRSIGVIAMTGSYLVPFLTGSNTNDYNGLFIYITIINIASLALVYAKGWRVLQMISMLITFSLSNLLYDFGINKWIYISIFIALFQASSIYAILKTKKLIRLDIFNSIISTFVSVFWITSFASPDFRTVSFVGLSIATFAIALLFDRNRATISYTYIQLIASLTTLVFATYLQFSNNSTAFIIAFTFEVLASQWLLTKIFDDSKSFYILPYFHTIPILYFISESNGVIDNTSYTLFISNKSTILDLVTNITLNVFLIAAVYINAVLIDYTKNKEKSLNNYSKVLKILSAGLGFMLLLNIHALIIRLYSLSLYQVTNYSIPLLLAICSMLSLGFVLYKPISPNTSVKNFGFVVLYISTISQMLQMSQVEDLEKITVWFVFTIISMAILTQANSIKNKMFEYLGYTLLIGSLSLQLLTNFYQLDSTLRVIVYGLALLIALYLRLSTQFDKQFITQRVSDISLGFILLVLVFIELWSLGIVIRIITFVAVGILLILTGFVKKKS